MSGNYNGTQTTETTDLENKDRQLNDKTNQIERKNRTNLKIYRRKEQKDSRYLHSKKNYFIENVISFTAQTLYTLYLLPTSNERTYLQA